jgi:hypothetical protein
MNVKTQNQIKSIVRVQAVAVAAIAFAGGWLAGCSTTVYKQGDRAADAAWTTAMQVQTESQALAAAQATLSILVEKPAADLKPQFLSFSSAIETLVAAAKKAEVSGNHLVRSNAAFTAAWEKQLMTITNAEVRSRSEARKTEVSGRFDAAHKRYLQAQDTLRPLIGYLQDLRKALNTDLTPGGVEAVKGLATNANTTANKVQADLAQAIAELKALSASMSSAEGPAPG